MDADLLPTTCFGSDWAFMVVFTFFVSLLANQILGSTQEFLDSSLTLQIRESTLLCAFEHEQIFFGSVVSRDLFTSLEDATA